MKIILLAGIFCMVLMGVDGNYDNKGNTDSVTVISGDVVSQDLSELQKGMYFCTIRLNKNRTTFKLVKN